jgi:hypothetical protein
MKKTMKCVPFLFIILLTLSACNGQPTTSVTEKPVESQETDLSLYTFTSSFGYTMEYDPHLFYVLTDDSSDRFDLIEGDFSSEPQVFLSIQRVGGYTVAEYTSLLERKSPNGVYSVTETTFGADKRDAVTVTYEIDTDLGLVYYAETIIKVGSDLIYIEVVTYNGMPASIQTAINKMLDTFSVQN